MHGLGIDIIRISRVGKWVDDEAMLDFVFTGEERREAFSEKHPHTHLACVYAAKEAFMKAVGTGWDEGIRWRDIEVTDGDEGPAMKLYGKAMDRCEGKRIMVSVSRDGDFAAAMIVIE